MGDIVDVRSGKDYKHLSEGNIPVYGTGGYMLSVNQALSYDEDAIGIGRKGTIDKPYILKAPFWTVDTLFYAVPSQNSDLDFVFDIFQNIDWKKKDESTGVPSLSKTAINEIDISAPCLEEQQVIGSYFSKIDHLIALHQRKCNELKNLKQYMANHMFVNQSTKCDRNIATNHKKLQERTKEMGELESVIEQRLIDQLCGGDSQWTYRKDIRTEEQLWITSNTYWSRTTRQS